MFNKTIKNIMSNYIPRKTITCDDRYLRWINKDIKQLILDKSHPCKSYIRNDKSLQFFNQFQFLYTRTNLLLTSENKPIFSIISLLTNVLS